jgi:hypothetical protein
MTILPPSTKTIQGASSAPPPVLALPDVREFMGCLATSTVWYYDCEHFARRPPGVYSHLVSQASRLVRVWDPYVLDDDAVLFSSLRPSASLQVLTAKGFNKGGLPRVASFEGALMRHGLLSGQVEVRCHNTLTGISDPIHDRYLFVDDHEIYKVGASLGYHRGQRFPSHAIVRIDEPLGKSLLLNRFLRMWDHVDTKRVP